MAELPQAARIFTGEAEAWHGTEVSGSMSG
jgi:hypothetical protein